MKAALIVLMLFASLPSQAGEQATVTLGGREFTVEIARGAREQALGLMYRTSLPADRGMLFVYPDARPRSFWMKNTVIPLDILFFDAEGRLINVASATPCRTDPCPTYGSMGPAQYVLELRAGTAQELDLRPGARLDLPDSLP